MIRRTKHSIVMCAEPLESRQMLTGSLAYGFGIGAKQVDIATDSASNAYVVGTFTGTVDFNPSPRKSYSLTAVNPAGDMFVARYMPDSRLAWVVQLGEATTTPVPAAIASAGTSGVWVAGTFDGTQEFRPGVATFPMTAVGGKDYFLLGLATDGTFRTANRMGTVDNETAVDVAVDGSGRVQVVGTQDGATNKSVYVARFTGRGKVSTTDVWSGAAADVIPTSIATYEGGATIITGSVSDDVDFNGAGAGGLVDGPAGFVLQVSSFGNFSWVQGIQGATVKSAVVGRGPTNGSSAVTVAGSFTGTINLNEGGATGYYLVSYGGTDAFLANYSSNGTYVWANGMGGTQDDAANSIDADAYGSVYIGGTFKDTANFRRSATLVSRGGTDGFFAKFNGSGKQLVLSQVGGTGEDVVMHMATGLGVDIFAVGPLFASGNYNATGTLTLAPLPGHTEDMYVIRMD